jgi:uncharacterized CHY-type Zn-finger protein
MENKTNKIIVKGQAVDANTRCVHYHSPLDVIAIKFKCCATYFPCYYCHQEASNHPGEVWKKEEFNQTAILCGSCFQEMSIAQYKRCNYHCPFCDTTFNPNCINHDHLYFEQ